MEASTTRKSLKPGRAIVSGDVTIHCESVNGQVVSVLVVSPWHTRVVRSNLGIHFDDAFCRSKSK